MKYYKTDEECKDLSGESDFWNDYYQIVIKREFRRRAQIGMSTGCSSLPGS
jgi:hypothetical protein